MINKVVIVIIVSMSILVMLLKFVIIVVSVLFIVLNSLHMLITVMGEGLTHKLVKVSIVGLILSSQLSQVTLSLLPTKREREVIFHVTERLMTDRFILLSFLLLFLILLGFFGLGRGTKSSWLPLLLLLLLRLHLFWLLVFLFNLVVTLATALLTATTPRPRTIYRSFYGLWHRFIIFSFCRGFFFSLKFDFDFFVLISWFRFLRSRCEFPVKQGKLAVTFFGILVISPGLLLFLLIRRWIDFLVNRRSTVGVPAKIGGLIILIFPARALLLIRFASMALGLLFLLLLFLVVFCGVGEMIINLPKVLIHAILSFIEHRFLAAFFHFSVSFGFTLLGLLLLSERRWINCEPMLKARAKARIVLRILFRL